MIYWSLWWMLQFFLKICCSFEVYGPKERSFTGPLLIASNHQTNWDPFIIHAAIRSRMAFMAKEELFKIPILGWIMYHEKAIPVRRGAADRQAIRDALEALKSGRILGIFPEGTRSKDGVLKKFQPGMAMLATKSNSPVLPTWIHWSKKGKASVWLGKLIFPPTGEKNKEDQEKFTEQIRAAMLELAETAKRTKEE